MLRIEKEYRNVSFYELINFLDAVVVRKDEKYLKVKDHRVIFLLITI